MGALWIPIRTPARTFLNAWVFSKESCVAADLLVELRGASIPISRGRESGPPIGAWMRMAEVAVLAKMPPLAAHGSMAFPDRRPCRSASLVDDVVPLPLSLGALRDAPSFVISSGRVRIAFSKPNASVPGRVSGEKAALSAVPAACAYRASQLQSRGCGDVLELELARSERACTAPRARHRPFEGRCALPPSRSPDAASNPAAGAAERASSAPAAE